MSIKRKVHDYDSAWKTILEAFEAEIVELLFPEVYEKIDWNIESESLDNELLEIQKEIFNKEETGKDKNYIYKLSDLKEDILTYNFRTIDVDSLELENINDSNPLKLVFKIAKRLLETGANEEEIFRAKVELFNELVNYKKVRTIEQRKALTYFLEYLFLIQDEKLLKEFREVKDKIGGAIEMSVDEIRELYLKKEGIEEGIELTKRVFKLSNEGRNINEIAEICKITVERVKKILS